MWSLTGHEEPDWQGLAWLVRTVLTGYYKPDRVLLAELAMTRLTSYDGPDCQWQAWLAMTDLTGYEKSDRVDWQLTGLSGLTCFDWPDWKWLSLLAMARLSGLNLLTKWNCCGTRNMKIAVRERLYSSFHYFERLEWLEFLEKWKLILERDFT